MAFTRPVKGQDISAEDFGSPAYDLLTHPPGRIWRSTLGAANGSSGFVTVPGSTSVPGETGVRKWLVSASLHVDPAEPGVPKTGYTFLYINGAGVDQYALYIPAVNVTVEQSWMLPAAVAISSVSLQISSFRTAAVGSFMTFIDGGP